MTQGRIWFARVDDLDGIIHLTVDASTHRWAVYHSTITVATVLRGTGTWMCRGRTRELRRGVLMTLQPGDVQVTHRLDSAGSMRALFVRPERFSSWLGQDGSDAEFRFHDIQIEDAGAFRAFVRLHRALGNRSSSPLERWERLAVAFHLLAERHGERPPEPAREEPGLAAQLRERIHAACASDLSGRSLTVGALASELEARAVDLVRSFERRYGLSPYAYLCQLRLARARHLLEQGPRQGCRTLAAVARAAGYASFDHMNGALARDHLLSPANATRQRDGRNRWRWPHRQP